MAAKSREWNRNNPEKHNANNASYYQRHKERLREEHKARHARNRDVDNARAAIRSKKEREEARAAALQHYAGDPPRCACCGETIREFLCFDHMYGGGAKHSRERKSKALGLWLLKNGFPDGFQVLCFNCNAAKSIHGQCPHVRLRSVEVAD
jgi:hypothetical protein